MKNENMVIFHAGDVVKYRPGYLGYNGFSKYTVIEVIALPEYDDYGCLNEHLQILKINIPAYSGTYYSCLLSGKYFEKVDPTKTIKLTKEEVFFLQQNEACLSGDVWDSILSKLE